MNLNIDLKKIIAYLSLSLALCIFFSAEGYSQSMEDSSFAKSDSYAEFSTAGFYELKGSGREVQNFNVGWRFYKGDIQGADQENFKDTDWGLVSLPHGTELLPIQGSGGKNYQGITWYRKHFSLENKLKGKKVFIHFEGVMGKCEIWVNGHSITKHYGGFLPIVLDITKWAKFDGEPNLIAVKADNSNDPSYPPGKPQESMDFSYFGGIYRDAWLITTDNVYITDSNHSGNQAGGGVFVHFDNFSEKRVTAVIETELLNDSGKAQRVNLETSFKDKEGKTVGKIRSNVTVFPGKKQTVKQTILLKIPHLWHPDSPYLYNMISSVKKGKKNIDGYRTRVGIRKIEFRGKDGFYLNGKPFEDKLIGANRHQDYAFIGNALPNSLHWRDVKKLRDAGMRVIRSAHYPQDPAFMDACDELGMFMIVPTPGWQFFNWKNKEFANRVYDDIRQMVRRDRNHASILMWEPILNETHYPEDFAGKVHGIVHEEYPYQGAFTVSDHHAKGHEVFDVLFAHPIGKKIWELKNFDMRQSVFTREWGDNVDDWNSQNSSSRVVRAWGEQAQLVQAIHFANPTYHTYFTSFERLYNQPRQHIGGALWHAFDHQRGYYPDPFYGGVLDAFRQPKYSYYMFASQRDPKIKLEKADSGPMIYIANEMSPFSSEDVTIFSNCDEVRLTVFGKEKGTKKVNDGTFKMPHPPVTFEKVYHYMEVKRLHRSNKKEQAYILAEGLIDGKVVASMKRYPALRPTRLVLHADYDGLQATGNGSDVIKVVAHLVDQKGNTKRLNQESIRFEVSGEGALIHSEEIGSNPHPIMWGTAPALIRTTTKAGKIKIKASIAQEGKVIPLSGELVIQTRPALHKMNYLELPKKNSPKQLKQHTGNESVTIQKLREQLKKTEHELFKFKQKETEKNQADFEGDVLGQ